LTLQAFADPNQLLANGCPRWVLPTFEFKRLGSFNRGEESGLVVNPHIANALKTTIVQDGRPAM
jgi:hypothetical protein